ncbi:MAG TPA: hypothetical protein HA224_04895 [Nanoarchaeota archaeon]|nr:hypothetical protein [Nanoarchaeota archaeon]
MIKWRVIWLLVVFVIGIIFYTSSANALIMSPPQAIVAFTPGGTSNFEFELMNDESRSLPLQVYAEGSIADLVLISEKSFTLGPHELRKVKFEVKFPQSMELPATLSVIAKAPASASKGQISANMALAYKVSITGKSNSKTGLATAVKKETSFASSSADVEIKNINFENINKEIAKLEIEVQNVGTGAADVSADVRFGETGTSTQIAPISVTGGATRKLTTYVDVKGLPAGSYNAEVLLKYADKVKRQIFKIQIIEAGTGQDNSIYTYAVLGLLVLFNVVFIALILVRKLKKQ